MKTSVTPKSGDGSAASTPSLIYLHGFNSSPHSYKAQRLKSVIETTPYRCTYLIPKLSYSPKEVDVAVSQLIEQQMTTGPVVLIGSSLGGYYAIHLAQKYGLYAALINPAVKPYELLSDYLGENANYYSGERYTLTDQHMRELIALDVKVVSYPDRLFLLTQTADQTLNYREAIEKLPHSPVWVEAGGDHEFQNFEKFIPAIMSFLKIKKLP